MVVIKQKGKQGPQGLLWCLCRLRQSGVSMAAMAAEQMEAPGAFWQQEFL